MAVLRRTTAVVGIAAMVLQRLFATGDPMPGVAESVAAAVLLANEFTRWQFGRLDEERRLAVVHAQIVCDTLALTALLHLGGGITSPALILFVPPFFVYGAVLPLGHAFAQAGVTLLELSGLAALECFEVIPHYSAGFYPEEMFQRWDFLVLTILFVWVIVALCASMSHYLRVLVRVQEERASTLASERGALLASNEREAARVRALLDVAQHVSGTNSIEEFLGAVCDTTVTLARVPRVEVFLWDADADCLRLAAARGLSETVREDGQRYPGDMPIVARLRQGEVVDFGAKPSHVMVGGRVETPFRRGFAAPLVCRGSFQGALFVGYDDEHTEEFLELVLGIARQAALALANVRTMAQQQEDAEVSNILLQLSQALSACLDEEALWQLIIRACAEVLELPWSIACRFEERVASFGVVGTNGLPEAAQKQLGENRFKLEDCATLKEIVSGRELLIGDPEGGARLELLGDMLPGGWLAVPLFRGGWVAGLLVAGHTAGRPRSFSRRQVRLAEGLAHHASIALQNARLVADLEAADQLKSEFVSTMSHELRTPLNVIIGYTEMLREGAVGPVSPGQLELVNRLDARGRELLELIEATLHVGRLEAGRDTVEIAPIELRDLVKALQASTAGLPRQQGVEFVWDVPTEARERVMTDRAKLSLVVRNLVSNAFKFTATGTVTVRMSLAEDSLTIVVSDTGIGISNEHLPIIFDMFRQVDGSMTRRHGGVGLGLYIVKQFVGRLGGSIDVSSTPGQGSTFKLVLPGALRDDRRRGEYRAA